MTSTDPMQSFIGFFKALADANRLKIVGLLAHKPHSVEELAANLGISSPTVSHHLRRLLAADLVEARVEQYYSVYALRPDRLHRMAEQLLSVDALKAATPAANLDAYSTKVLGDYIIGGKLKTIPGQLKKREVVLRRLAEEFEIGERYPEKRVNEVLQAFHPDYATLRRELVNMKFLARGQGYYWRATSDG